MKKILLVSLITLACTASSAQTTWSVSTTTPQGKVTFTVLPETVAINSNNTIWRADVALQGGGQTNTVQIAVIGCRTLQGETAMLNPDGTAPDAKDIVPWSHKGEAVADKLATLVCAAAHKVGLVFTEIKKPTSYRVL